MPLIPSRIKVAGGNDTLVVEWSDGHVSAYPYPYLRHHCPCAACSQKPAEGASEASPFPMFGARTIRPDRAELVGRYALQVFWNDGHSSGIYSFEHLRELCPCAQCKAGEGARDVTERSKNSPF